MRRAYIYFLLLVIDIPAAWSHECERNMLSTPNAFGYAKVSKGVVALTGDFTIEFWMKASTFTKGAGLFEQGKAGDSGTISIRLENSNKIVSSFAFITGRETIESPSLLSPIAWNHVAVTFKSGDSLRLYINGDLVASQKTNAGRLRTANGDSTYFAYSPLTTIVYTGAIDEFRIWSMARSPQDIKSAVAQTFFGTEVGLASYWRFDDDPSQKQFHDFTGRGLNGIVVGSAAIVPAPQSSPVGGPDHPGYMLVAVEQAIDMQTVFCSIKDTVVHIRNIGLETVEIEGIGFELGNIFSIQGSPDFPLPPGSNVATISIRAVTDTLSGIYSDVLVVTAKNVCGGQLRIPIKIQAIRTDVGFTYKETDVVNQIPFLPCKFPDQRSITLVNKSDRKITINSLRFDKQVGISLLGGATPFIMDVGESKTIPFRFEPGIDGTFTDTLRVTTVECNRSAKLGFRFSRSSIDYDITAQKVDFPEQRLLPGSTITLDTEIVIVNSGTSDLFLQKLEISGRNYKFSGETDYLYTGDTARIRVRFESKECGDFPGELTIDVPTACSLKIRVPLFTRVRGPEFEPTHSSYKLEPTCDPKDTTVGIINRSGKPISITNVQFLQNAFRFVTAPLPALPLDNGDTFYAKVRFQPAAPGRHSDTIRFFNEVCGYIDIPLEGYLGVGEISLSDTSVEFGRQCDLTSSTRTLKITNTTGKFFSITSMSSLGSTEINFDTPLPISLRPGQDSTLTFTFAPSVFGKYETTFFFTFNGCYVANLTARGVRERAKVRWETETLNFGEHCPDTIVSSVIKLYNDGFANVVIESGVTEGPHFAVLKYLPGSNIATGSSLDIPVNFFADSIGHFSSVLTVVLGPCGDTIRLPLTGVGGPPPSLIVSDTLIDFDNVRVGKSDTICIELSNPSCIPISISEKDISLSFPSGGIRVSDASRLALPQDISLGSPFQLCFIFSPTANGLVSRTAIINIGNELIRVHLRGTGVEPLLVYDPSKGRTIEFGEVEVGEFVSRRVTITNFGLDTANIYRISTTLPFENDNSLPAVIPPFKSIYVDIIFRPTAEKLYREPFVVEWEKGSDSIALRGAGISPGLAFSTTLVDFGDVRLEKDSLIDVIIKGSQNASYPLAIDSQRIRGIDSDDFRARLIEGDLQLDSSRDSIVFRFQYVPSQEWNDTADFIIYHNARSDSLPLRGRGVQAHLVVIEDVVEFGPVVLKDSIQKAFRIRNDGNYPLHITSITQNFEGTFSDIRTSINSQLPIPPDSSILVWATFKPTKAVSYSDSLTIYADAHEKYDYVYLTGKGTYTPTGEPNIIYRVDDATLKVGDIVDLPVYISGADVEKVETDSLYLKIKYDPTVAYVFDTIITENTISAGMRSEVTHHYEDSTVLITLSGSSRPLGDAILFKLRVEALIGPSDSTRFVVQDALPQNLGNTLLNSGLFYVTDCGDYRTNILLKGPYSISSPQPNPANGTVILKYELGLDGPVSIRIVDALGREVKSVLDRFERRGAHQIAFSVDELPSGSYIYVISSLEYSESGKLLIAE